MPTALDTAGTGWITRDDLAAALPTIGLTLEPAQLDHIMAMLDPDHDGRIKYVEWLACTCVVCLKCQLVNVLTRLCVNLCCVQC